MSSELLDPPHIAMFVAALLAAGAVSGFISGLLGIGGGIVIVPALYFIFSAIDVGEAVRMHLAVGTSLAAIAVTSLISARAHGQRGALDIPLLKRWAPGIMLGVLAGATLAQFMDGRSLTGIFATFALLMSLHIAFGRESWRLGEEPPRGVTLQAIGAVIGGISALVGIGGGGMAVPILALYGVPIHRAIGIGAAIGFLVGLPGAISFMLGGLGAEGLPPFSVGYVNLLAALIMLPTSMLIAPLGARAAHALPTRKLKLAFAIFLAVMSARMYYSILG